MVRPEVRSAFGIFIFLWIAAGCRSNIEQLSSENSAHSGFNIVIGEYECFGTENGLQAFAAKVFFYADSSVVIDWYGLRSYNSGTWRYEESAQQIMFDGDFELATGTYIPETRSLSLVLKEGIQRAHIENGELDCNRRST